MVALVRCLPAACYSMLLFVVTCFCLLAAYLLLTCCLPAAYLLLTCCSPAVLGCCCCSLLLLAALCCGFCWLLAACWWPLPLLWLLPLLLPLPRLLPLPPAAALVAPAAPAVSPAAGCLLLACCFFLLLLLPVVIDAARANILPKQKIPFLALCLALTGGTGGRHQQRKGMFLAGWNERLRSYSVVVSLCSPSAVFRTLS